MADTPRVPSEEERLLTRAQVAEILRRQGREVTAVVRYCDDGAALFIGAFEKPWTAWITLGPEEAVSVQYEPGWSADFGAGRVSAPLTSKGTTP